MNVLIVQNHEIVGPDLVEEVLRRRGVAYAVAKTFSPDPPPAAKDFDAVIMLGSPGSCGRLEGHRELLLARGLVADFVARGKAALGICFGGQLLAQVLGAEVRWNEAGEFGCYEVSLTDAGARSPLFEGFPSTFSTVQWHHETFGLPSGATLLATSEACAHQAFVVGHSVGVQFHPEASPQTVEVWAKAHPAGPADVGKTAEEMLAECRRTADEQARLCDQLVANFLEFAAC